MALFTSQFDYTLPSDLIAQTPALRRDQSRLMVIDRKTKKIEHKLFKELPSYLKSTDTLFRNNASVLPARLRGLRPTGGAVECLLLEKMPDKPETWRCLLKPGRKLPEQATFHGVQNEYIALVVKKDAEGIAEVSFLIPSNKSLVSIARQIGEMPLPPYIERANQDQHLLDAERYQTVYARAAGSVAAPTAGLHFTPELLDKIRALGVKICFVTLHVGAGTFLPVKVENVVDHKMHSEYFEIGEETVAAINAAKKSGHRVIAVGTTATRTLESMARLNAGKLNVYAGKTDIFLFPPAQFQIVDALLTNFHLPESTLLMLVSAFAAPGEKARGRDLILKTYAEAIRERYRFFSYGDAMLIL